MILVIGKTSDLQVIDFKIKTHDIIEINEIKEYGVFQSSWITTWKDERLKWPSECQKEENSIATFQPPRENIEKLPQEENWGRTLWRFGKDYGESERKG